MYPAIEAIAKGGIIEPLEPVKFDANEQRGILRLSKSWTQSHVTTPTKDWRDFVGSLKSSPNFNGDPVAAQQIVRAQ